jgi:hypothetical protein
MATKKAAPRIKNYVAATPVDDCLTQIRTSLAQHKARRIVFESNDKGEPTEISFQIDIKGVAYVFLLPARLEQVLGLVEQAWRDMGRPLKGEALIQQARRTAWANIRDWVLAQMALIDSGMARTEEVFFPYLLNQDGQTAFEAFEERLALPAPQGKVIVSETW